MGVTPRPRIMLQYLWENSMTTVEANAERIFADARLMRDAALERMAAGDVRDAAEKAWCATVRATEALVLVRTGQEPGTSTMAGRRLQALSVSDQPLWELRTRYLRPPDHTPRRLLLPQLLPAGGN